MNQWVIKRIFANRFRSTTWYYRRTYDAMCDLPHRSIVGGLLEVQPLPERLGFVQQQVLLVLARLVVLLRLGQQVEQLVFAQVEFVGPGPVAVVAMSEVHIAMHRSTELPVVAHRSMLLQLGKLQSIHWMRSLSLRKERIHHDLEHRGGHQR